MIQVDCSDFFPLLNHRNDLNIIRVEQKIIVLT